MARMNYKYYVIMRKSDGKVVAGSCRNTQDIIIIYADENHRPMCFRSHGAAVQCMHNMFDGLKQYHEKISDYEVAEVIVKIVEYHMDNTTGKS